MENYINYAYVILITPTGNGYACYAIKKLDKNKFSVAASYCSPKDAKHFNKKKSRMIAKSRLNDEDRDWYAQDTWDKYNDGRDDNE